MKMVLIALICASVLVSFSAWAQTWVPPAVNRDGTVVEGHWQTPEDLRQKNFSTPGKVNPYTGQFTPYTGSMTAPQPTSPTPGTPDYPLPNYQRDNRYRGWQPKPQP